MSQSTCGFSRMITVKVAVTSPPCAYKHARGCPHFPRSVSPNPKSGRLSVLGVCCFCLAFRKLQGVFEVSVRRPKKPRKSLRHLRFAPQKRREPCCGQSGCRKELVSAAPVSFCRDQQELNIAKLSVVNLPVLPVFRLESPSSNTCLLPFTFWCGPQPRWANASLPALVAVTPPFSTIVESTAMVKMFLVVPRQISMY